ncbi:hypothetical protein M422DRAFT_251714 [Sphaerobolus stellatus SS14]|uniref:Uncharacterized protein n=1 Tax=Sphaerobolus stellatus (strain SS14) TaxID=990650 RepID=A0A0C9VQV8_SPHS4|nr:hypothetical protein M422DRAFT_251714 [Sphaerobolus stellatus SS14]
MSTRNQPSAHPKRVGCDDDGDRIPQVSGSDFLNRNPRLVFNPVVAALVTFGVTVFLSQTVPATASVGNCGFLDPI